MITRCPADQGPLDREGTWWRCPVCEQRFALPLPGFQRRFVSCPADILLAASGAGVGKTRATMMAAARWVTVPGYRGLLLRRQEDDLFATDGLIDQAKSLYEPMGGVWYSNEQTFRFDCEGGESSIQLSHVGKDYKLRFQGPAAAFLGIDELTQIPPNAFWWFFSRLRSAVAPIRVRCTFNPDADSWVYDLVSWWIGEDGCPRQDRAQQLRYIAGRDGKRFWADTRQEAAAAAGRPPQDALSVAFLTGLLSENAFLAGTGYEGRMGLLDLEDAASLAGNRWVRQSRGKLLRPEWLERTIDQAPPGTRWVRAWDTAATPEAEAVSGTSYTAGILLGQAPDGRLIVGDAILGRWGAAEVETFVCAAAGAPDPHERGKRAEHAEVRHIDGRRVPVRLCREHAGAGKAVGQRFVQLLAGWDARAEVESGDKGVRLRPFAAQAEAGNVYLVRGPWNGLYRAHMLALTTDGKGRPNDAGDGTARALEALTESGPPTLAERQEAVEAAQEFGRAVDLSGFDPGWGGDGPEW